MEKKDFHQPQGFAHQENTRCPVHLCARIVQQDFTTWRQNQRLAPAAPLPAINLQSAKPAAQIAHLAIIVPQMEQVHHILALVARMLLATIPFAQIAQQARVLPKGLHQNRFVITHHHCLL